MFEKTQIYLNENSVEGTSWHIYYREWFFHKLT